MESDRMQWAIEVCGKCRSVENQIIYRVIRHVLVFFTFHSMSFPGVFNVSVLVDTSSPPAAQSLRGLLRGSQRGGGQRWIHYGFTA